MEHGKTWQTQWIGGPGANDELHERPPRLPRNVLPIAWIGWLAIAAVTIGVFVAALPLRDAELRANCAGGASCAAIAASLVALDTFSALVWLTMAALIFWRRPGDRVGLFTSLALLTFGVARFPDTPLALGVAHPEWGLLVEALRFLGSVCLSLFFYVFPDGQFVPPATRWVAFAWIAIQVPEFFLPGVGANPDQWSPAIRFAGFLGYAISVAAAQIYRYRRVSTPAQREQTRWVMLGITAALALYLILAFGYPLLASVSDAPMTLAPMVSSGVATLALLLVPVSLGVAILRRRLYNVDTLINRALVYGSLTALLAALYLFTVVGAQAAVGFITGERGLPPPIIVLSTLMTAALFQPLRRRLQHAIDRRFYRQRYNASKTIAAFGASLRTDTDLDDIARRLIEVVQETMGPEHISLWLARPVQRDKQALAPGRRDRPGATR